MSLTFEEFVHEVTSKKVKLSVSLLLGKMLIFL